MIETREFKKEDISNLNPLFIAPEISELREKGFSFTMYDDDKIIGSGGIDRIYNHMATAWLFIDKSACKEKKYLKPVVKQIRAALSFYVDVAPDLLRLDAACVDCREFVKFAKTVGFKSEAKLEHLGANGEDIVLMRYK